MAARKKQVRKPPNSSKEAKGKSRTKSNGALSKAPLTKSQLTKKRILDAAEMLFVQKGYYGTFIREIGEKADVQSALMYYHFESKEDLFRAVIERRSNEHIADLRSSLQAVLEGGGKSPPELEALILAYFEPVLTRTVSKDEGWRNYVRLLAQVACTPREQKFSFSFYVVYDEVMHEYFDQLTKIFPKASLEDLYWGFYFLQAVEIHNLIGTGLVDRQSKGLCDSSDLTEILDQLVDFVAGGFRSLAR